MRRTPQLGARGIYQIRHPYTVSTSKIYTCYAIRSFKDIYEVNQDVFTEYYLPVGLSLSDFQNDEQLGAAIITLMSEDNHVIYVPDTYIEAYPEMGLVNYHRLVLSVDLGALPEYVNLDFLKDSIHGIVNQIVGVDSTVNLNNVPYAGAVSPDDHQTLEAARLTNIQLMQTDRAKYIEQKRLTDALQQRIQTLETIITDNNLLL